MQKLQVDCLELEFIENYSKSQSPSWAQRAALIFVSITLPWPCMQYRGFRASALHDMPVTLCSVYHLHYSCCYCLLVNGGLINHGAPAGIEPAVFGSLVQRFNHYANFPSLWNY